jgi:hypothetical protein
VYIDSFSTTKPVVVAYHPGQKRSKMEESILSLIDKSILQTIKQQTMIANKIE